MTGALNGCPHCHLHQFLLQQNLRSRSGLSMLSVDKASVVVCMHFSIWEWEISIDTVINDCCQPVTSKSEIKPLTPNTNTNRFISLSYVSNLKFYLIPKSQVILPKFYIKSQIFKFRKLLHET